MNALGQPHGEGLYRFCNGDQFSGRYENGVPFGVGLVRCCVMGTCVWFVQTFF